MRRFVTLMCLFSTSTLSITLAAASSQPPPFCEAGALDILLTNDDSYTAPGIRALPRRSVAPAIV
jgi:hypothetical protein